MPPALPGIFTYDLMEHFMETLFECPICKYSTWKLIEKYTYLRDDLTTTKQTRYSTLFRKLTIVGRALFLARPRKRVAHYNSLSKYQKLRREVIFKVWFEHEREVSINSIYCATCGFTCYSPRPNDYDIARKYMYLKKYEPDIGGQSDYDIYAKNLDNQRASRIYCKCTENALDKKLYVLDYGGGNGKLLIPFIENKHICHIIDYNDKPISGITKIGNDINNYQTNVKYDVIICSHVLEHISDVSNLIKKLKDLLNPDGIIYAEVPLEIWAGLRIDADPVTHINFFTTNSLANLFLVNGFEIIGKKQQVSNYAKTFMEVVWVVAKKNNINSHTLLTSDTNKLLYPSRLYSLKKIFRLLIGPISVKIHTKAIE